MDIDWVARTDIRLGAERWVATMDGSRAAEMADGWEDPDPPTASRKAAETAYQLAAGMAHAMAGRTVVCWDALRDMHRVVGTAVCSVCGVAAH